MWSVGISVSPCMDAERIGYDNRQINRIVIRVAQFFLNRDMRVIFGHDWREDGVMRAVAEFASKVATGAKGFEETSDRVRSRREEGREQPRMLNVVPTGRESLSRAALEAEHDGGGVLEVIPTRDGIERLRGLVLGHGELFWEEAWEENRPAELTAFRQWITALLDPGCRICLGGKEKGHEGVEPGVMEEARLALKCEKPLYLLGGFGGATRSFGEDDEYGCSKYWLADNGLGEKDKDELFNTTDIERALRIISDGIREVKCRS